MGGGWTISVRSPIGSGDSGPEGAPGSADPVVASEMTVSSASEFSPDPPGAKSPLYIFFSASVAGLAGCTG